MKLNRRRFMFLSGTLAAGTVAAASAMNLSAATLNESVRQNIVLTSGLKTDSAFALGTNAGRSLVTLTSSNGYSGLLKQLSAAKGQQLFALLQPGDAILLEQALRDINSRTFVSRRVKAPENSTADRWAFSLGQQLAQKEQAPALQSHDGMALVAVTAYL